MINEKVSILTPCLNGEKFINRYLDSILNQTYKNLELVFIDDGSTDNTEKIVKSYIKKFNHSGMNLIYIKQYENGGQAKALNRGLKIFTGDYITWPDADDFLADDSIEKRVKFLQKHNEYGIVRTDVAVINESNINEVIMYFGKDNENKYKEDLFQDFIVENKVWFAPGSYMIRTKDFIEVVPDRDIYEGRGGQNWQMLLPILHKFKCGYIDEPLYNYVIRENSHSHNINGLEDLLKKSYEHEDILVNTINRINMNKSEKTYYLELIEEKYIRKRMNLGYQYKRKDLVKKNYKLLCKKYKISRNEKIGYLNENYILFNKLISIGLSIKKHVKSFNLL